MAHRLAKGSGVVGALALAANIAGNFPAPWNYVLWLIVFASIIAIVFDVIR